MPSQLGSTAWMRQLATKSSGTRWRNVQWQPFSFAEILKIPCMHDLQKIRWSTSDNSWIIHLLAAMRRLATGDDYPDFVFISCVMGIKICPTQRRDQLGQKDDYPSPSNYQNANWRERNLNDLLSTRWRSISLRIEYIDFMYARTKNVKYLYTEDFHQQVCQEFNGKVSWILYCKSKKAGPI